jgi:hypothetical protein
VGKKIRSVKDEINTVIDGKLYFVTKKGCWVFPPWSSTGGYATFSLSGKSYRVARELWRLKKGYIPAGMFICHYCDYPPCFNIEHLFMGTPADNIRDRDKKGRGSRQRFTICTEEDLKEIRRRLSSGEAVETLMSEYKISKARLIRIARGKEVPGRFPRKPKVR